MDPRVRLAHSCFRFDCQTTTNPGASPRQPPIITEPTFDVKARSTTSDRTRQQLENTQPLSPHHFGRPTCFRGQPTIIRESRQPRNWAGRCFFSIAHPRFAGGPHRYPVRNPRFPAVAAPAPRDAPAPRRSRTGKHAGGASRHPPHTAGPARRSLLHQLHPLKNAAWLVEIPAAAIRQRRVA